MLSKILLASMPLLASVIAAPKAAHTRRQLFNPEIDQNDANYYLGYRGADSSYPWSKYFNDSEIALNENFLAGLAKSPLPAASIPTIQEGAAALSEPGYLEVENGYGIGEDGTLFLAIQSFVPETFTGEQYDFWFSWHINETTKYKLWYPGAHQYAAVSSAQIADNAATASYRERYWNVTSYVDEYIGPMAQKLSISFFDPRLLGFELEDECTGVETIVTGFVAVLVYIEQNPDQQARSGFQAANVLLAHQVRSRPDGQGKEIRSRFWFGPAIVSAMRLIMDPLQLAHDLSVHCASEMTHLGTFLPQLFEEFKDDIAI